MENSEEIWVLGLRDALFEKFWLYSKAKKVKIIMTISNDPYPSLGTGLVYLYEGILYGRQDKPRVEPEIR